MSTTTTTRPPKLPPAWFIHTAWHVHRALYRLSGGRFLWTTSNKRGWGALLLTTIGRKSGKKRNVIIGYIEDGPSHVTLAMNSRTKAIRMVAQPRIPPGRRCSAGAPAPPCGACTRCHWRGA